MFQKKYVGWVLMIVVSVSPLIPWFFALQPISLRFANTYATFTAIGEILGLVGIAMFSLNLVLSARLQLFENYFGGMNRVYVAHHLFGGVSFLLLLAHPLALASAYIPISLKSAALYLLPGNDWSINVGIVSLLCMMTLLLLTFFITLPYEFWRFTHKFLGGVFLLAAVHGFFVPSDLSRDATLRNYMLIIVSAGTVAYLYRTILGRFLVRRFEYTVTKVTSLTNDIYEIYLKPIKKPVRYYPGQFVFISFQDSWVRAEVHPFSISSLPTDSLLMITAKVEGDYTKTLQTIKQYDTALLEGAYGRFWHPYVEKKQQVWIAGGIGITPFVGMARSLSQLDCMIDLYYSVRTAEEAVYKELFVQIAKENKNFRFIPWYTKTQGRLSVENMTATSGDLHEKDIFLCGPPLMMKSLKGQLKKIKISSRKIHSEEFQML